MAEFNRTSLDIMDELYAPFKEAQAQKQGLERQAGGAALARELQLTDAHTKRQQQLADADTAHQSGLKRITHQVDEQARTAEEAAQKRRDENLKDKRAEAGAVFGKLEKKGINLPFTIDDINNASMGQLSAYMRELNLEEEIDNANKKPHAEVLERLKAVDEEILREVMGLEADHLINWDTEGQKSKSELADMLGQAEVKKNSRKFGKNVVPQYKNLLKQQVELLEDTGILDIITTNAPGADEAAKAIAQDEMFMLNLNKALTNSKWWPGNPIPKKAEEILGLLGAGKLKEASERLDGEGQAGNQPLIEAFTRWSAKSQSVVAARVQDRILRMQGGAERLRSVGQQLNGLVDRHPWLEETVDILDIYTDNEYEAFQGRRRAASPPPTSLEPGDRGLEGATLFNQAGEVTDGSGEVIPGQAGNPNLDGLVAPADLNALVPEDEPDEKVEVAPVAPPTPSPTELPMYDTGAAGVREHGLNPERGMGKGVLRGRLEQGVKRLTHTNPTILGGPSMPQELVDYLEKYAPMQVSVHSRSGSRPRWKVQSSLSPERMGNILDKVQQGLIPPPPNIDIGQIMDVLAPALQRFNPIATPVMETDPASGFRTTR